MAEHHQRSHRSHIWALATQNGSTTSEKKANGQAHESQIETPAALSTVQHGTTARRPPGGLIGRARIAKKVLSDYEAPFEILESSEDLTGDRMIDPGTRACCSLSPLSAT